MSCSLREMEGSQPMGTDVFQIVILAGKSSKFYFTTQTYKIKRIEGTGLRTSLSEEPKMTFQTGGN
jgi:hypothetical protein